MTTGPGSHFAADGVRIVRRVRHTFTSDDRTSGTWTAVGEDLPYVYCEWRWVPAEGTLYVRHEDADRAWTPCTANPKILGDTFSELRWIALRIAEQLERESRGEW